MNFTRLKKDELYKAKKRQTLRGEKERQTVGKCSDFGRADLFAKIRCGMIGYRLITKLSKPDAGILRGGWR